MKPRNTRSVCVDPEWIGRSNCGQCAVRHVMPFAPLPAEALDDFLAPVTNLGLPAGAKILGPETRADALVALRRGFVKLFEISAAGRTRIVRLLGPGDVVGIEVLHSPPYLHAAETLTAVDLCHIPLAVVRDIESRMPAFHASLVERWHRAVTQADRFIVSLLDGPAPARVARLLLLLADLAGNEPPPRLSRLDTAAAVDIAPETASRIVGQFLDEGLLVEERTSFRIDRDALTRIAAG
jgi:CRP-like cAMP-binding protein